MRHQAIVVLGCRVGPDGRAGGALLRRVSRGAAAYHAGVAPVVVVSGGARWGAVPEAEAMRRELVQQGVPAAAIAPEWRSGSTRENARYSAELLRARGIEDVALVTCDDHMPRALRAFRRAGLRATPVPAVSPRRPLGAELWRRGREHVSALLDGARAGGFG